MNLYHFLEFGVIALISVISVYQVIKLLMPRLVNGVRAVLAQRLEQNANGNFRRKLAARLRGVTASAGCGAGCSSGCNNCSLATHVHPPLAGDDNSSN